MVSCLSGKVAESDQEALRILQEMPLAQRRGIWVEIGMRLDLTSQQAHDYFYNTYIKRCYDDPSPFKEEMKETLMMCMSGKNQKEIVRDAIQLFVGRHPEMNFCERKVYQQMYHYVQPVQRTYQQNNKGSLSREDVRMLYWIVFG